ncbi:hypothetical protein WAC87_003645 [Shigella flexneri]
MMGHISIIPDYRQAWISHHISYDPETNEMKMQLVSKDAHKGSMSVVSKSLKMM